MKNIKEKIKETNKKKKISLIIVLIVAVFAAYNIFGGDVTDEVYYGTEYGSGFCMGKFKITNEEELKAFEILTGTSSDDYKKFDLDKNTIFIEVRNGGCPSKIDINKVKVNNFVSIDFDMQGATCASISRYGAIAVIPKKMLWHTYTGNWNNPLDIYDPQNPMSNRESILKGYYCYDL